MNVETRDRIISGTITAIVVALILLLLFLGSMRWDRASLAASSIPSDPEEELFIDPELMELGEDEATTVDEPAPSPLGEPEPAETDNNKLVTPGENPKPTPPKEDPVTQTKPSSVQTTKPSATDKERERISSSVANSFSSTSGRDTGSTSASGSGGTGVGVAGNARGRTFLGCPAPQVTLRNKTTVVVNVVVDEEGRVTSASYASGSASQEIRSKCVAAARSAKWSAKRGASSTHGTITFTITPK